jgi:DNA replication protein DnaC
VEDARGRPERCSCFRQLLTESLFAASNIRMPAPASIAAAGVSASAEGLSPSAPETASGALGTASGVARAAAVTGAGALGASGAAPGSAAAGVSAGAPAGAPSGAACFGSFDETLFSDQADAAKYGHPMSPRENIVKIRDSALSFAQSFSERQAMNLYFFGRAGTGKTFMATAIAEALLRKGHTVLYLAAPALFNAITEYRLRSFRDEGYSDHIYRSILEAELLIIDDLGTESMTNARYAEFITLLNERVADIPIGAGAAPAGRMSRAAGPVPAAQAKSPALDQYAAGADPGLRAIGPFPAARAAAMEPFSYAAGSVPAAHAAGLAPATRAAGPASGAAVPRARPRSTIISTNMDLRALRSVYDERIVSRIIGAFAITPFFGDDVRLRRRAARQ